MSLKDTVVVVVLLIFFAILAIVTGLIWNAVNQAVMSSDVPQIAKDAVDTAAQGWPGMVDWLFACLLFGLPLVSMGLAYFNDISPVFFYASLGMILLVALIAWSIQDGWASFIGAGGIAAQYAISSLPITNFVMSRLGFYSMFVFLFISWGTYVKLRSGVGYV